MQRRRLLLASGLAATAPALWPVAARAAAPLKIGFIYSGPIADIGWTYQQVIAWLRDIENEDPGAKPVTAHLRGLVESFQMKRYMEVVGGLRAGD